MGLTRSIPADGGDESRTVAAGTSRLDASHKRTRTFSDDKGVVFIIGRGESDINITYTAQYNTNGTLVYSYPNANGDGTIVTTVKP